MVGRTRFIRLTASSAAGALVLAIVGSLGAQTTGGDNAQNISVKSMVTTVYDAPQKLKLPEEEQGNGASDPHGSIITVGGKARVFYAFTQGRDIPGKQGRLAEQMQGMFGIRELAPDGSLAAAIPNTEFRYRRGQNQYRNFMKPFTAAVGATAAGDTRHTLTVISTEMNGNQGQNADLTGVDPNKIQSNGNPQVVGIVQDANTGKVVKEYNLITLLLNSVGQGNDQQQWGTPEIAAVLNPDGSAPAGPALVGMSIQRNNQTCWFGVFAVNPDGSVAAKGLTKNEDKCQHGRPSAHVLPGATATSVKFLTTHVRANAQPSEIGVASDVVTYNGGQGAEAVKRTASALVAKSVIVDNNDKRKNLYATQPTDIVAIGTGGKTIIGVVNSLSNPQHQDVNNKKGHAGGTNTTEVRTFDSDLKPLDAVKGVGPILGGARHLRAAEGRYGQVTSDNANGSPSFALLAGSSIGTGAAGYNVLTIDPGTGKIAQPTRDKVFTIATNSDIAGLCTMGKANPQDQAGCFLNAARGALPNTSTKYPEVKTFAVAFAQGRKEATSTRESLYVSLVPMTWQATVKVNPAGSTTPENVPAGPTPITTPASEPLPQDPSTAGVPGSTAVGGDGELTSGGGTTRGDAAASSCAMSSAPTNSGAGYGILGLGLALAAARRRKGR